MPRHVPGPMRRILSVLLLVPVTACAGSGSAERGARNEPPRPLDVHALNRAFEQHYPAALRAQGRRGAVLVDVHVTPGGTVSGVDLVPRTPDSAGVHMVLIDREGRTVQRTHRPVYDPTFGPAAQAALLDARFSPALRNGMPVAETVRMTVEFGPTSGR